MNLDERLDHMIRHHLDEGDEYGAEVLFRTKESIAKLKKENKSLKEFWNRLCEYIWDGMNFDGGEHQEWGLELGLLRIEIYDPEGKHKDWNVQEVIAGDEFFVNNIVMPPDALADTQEQLTKNR